MTENLKNPWLRTDENPIPQGPFVLAYHPKWVQSTRCKNRIPE